MSPHRTRPIGRRRSLAAALVAIVCLTGAAGTIRAQSQTQQSSGELLIDISGSMSENDPTNLRWDGILTLTNLLTLGGDNSLGVRYFTRRDTVRVPHLPVTRETYPRFEEAARVKNESRGATDLVPSLENAAEELVGRKGQRFVIVVSDGAFSRSESVARAADRVIDQGGRIYFICMSGQGLGGDDVNTALINACRRSGGNAYGIRPRNANAKAETLRVFLEIFMQVSPPSMTLLTDGDGRFSLGAAHKSFLAVDPRGKRLGLESPFGNQKDLGIQLDNWSVAGRERPPLAEVARRWESPGWRLTSADDGTPIAGALIYVHSDVGIEVAGAEQFRASEGVETRAEVRVSLDSLEQWWTGGSRGALLDGLFVDYSLRALESDASLVEAAGRFDHESGGVYATRFPATLRRGEYIADLALRHEDQPATRLASARVPLDVLPPHLAARMTRIEGDDAAPLRTSEESTTPYVHAGESIRIELDFDPSTQTQAGANKIARRYRLDKATVQLTEVATDERLTLALEAGSTKKLESGGGVWVSSPTTLDSDGVYEGEIIALWSTVFETRDPLSGALATREEAHEDALYLPTLRVRPNRIDCGWDSSHDRFLTSEPLRFAATLRVQGPPESNRELVANWVRAGIDVRVTGPLGEFTSNEDADRFVLDQLTSTEGSGGIQIAGAFLGATESGNYRVELMMPESETAVPYSTRIDSKTVAVEAIPIVFGVTAVRGAEEVQLLSAAAGDELEPLRIHEDQTLRFTVRGTERLDTALHLSFAKAPELTVLTGATSRAMALEVRDDRFAVDGLELAPGRHELLLRAELEGRKTLEYTVDVVVDALPTPVVAAADALREVYGLHEDADFEGRVTFPLGSDDDRARWLADVEIHATVDGEEREIQSFDRHSAATAFRFRVDLPSDEEGRHLLAIEVVDGRGRTSTLEVPFVVEPLFVFRVEQEGRTIASSLGGEQSAADPTKPLALVVDSLVPELAASGGFQVFARALDGSDSMAPMRLELGVPLSLELSDERSASHRFLLDGELIGADGSKRKLAWESTPIVLERPPWHRTAPGMALLGLGATVLLSGLFLAWWVRPDAPLPVLAARVTRISPEYESLEVRPEDGMMSRLRARGQRRRSLRIGDGGDIGFGMDHEQLGLGDNAHIDIDVAAGADLGRDGENYLVVHGRNGGSTMIVIDGHLQATLPGEERAELCLDGLHPPIFLEIKAGAVCMQVQLELIDPLTGE